MFKNYLKISLRNLFKYKIYTFINIAGFAIGLASCIMILLFVGYELSYDSFHEEADNIYRVAVNGKVGDNQFNQAVTAPPMAKALVDDYPEVLKSLRIQPSENMLIRTGEEIFIENDFIWADSTFFEIFSYNMILGDAKEVLAEPHTVVLTRKTAMKYFGRLDVVGTILEFEDFTPYKITGICEDPPQNAHFNFDILASLQSLDYDDADYWLNHSFHTYVLLQDGFNPQELEAKFPDLIKQYVGPQLQSAIGNSIDQFYENGGIFEYHLQPLTDIHLKSDLDYEIGPNGNITYVYIFSIIALFILIIACINFMNLSTARSITRAREVGVRKVLGSNIGQLIRQFLSESILLTTLAMIIAIGLVYLFLPYFNNIAGKEFEFSLFDTWYTLPALILTILMVGLLAGAYPALYLSSFQPVKVLKTSLTSNEKGSTIRKALVVFQFSISIFLISSTLIVQSQLNYINEKNLGWDKDHIFVIKRAWAIENNEEAFRNDLLKNPNILTFSSSWSVPGRGTGATVFFKVGSPRSEQHLLNTMQAKYDFDKTFKFELTEGRFFSKEFLSDSTAVVINETAAKTLGLENPLGKQIALPGGNQDEDYVLNIVGVLKDFHFESFHQKIRPLVIFLANGWPGYVTLKISPENIQETIAYTEAAWEKIIPDKPFEYFFMDEDFAKLYNDEIRTSKIFSSFSLLAIFIACLGLFGLATFTTLQKTKEIGIRKTLGASVPVIVYLLSRQFSIWVIIANIIAWPAAYYFMQTWLNNFEYRIEISLFSFLIAGIVAFLIALITVIYQAIKAAIANPVDSLRYE